MDDFLKRTNKGKPWMAYLFSFFLIFI
jgi:hypothetical protein